VNYASDLKTPIQRWYRYKEGYSIKLVDQILNKYKVKEGDLIVDPFCGSGSTLVQAKMRKCNSLGFEINPFSAFLARAKTQDYSKKDKDELVRIVSILKSLKKKKISSIPKLSTIEKIFDKDTLHYLLTLKEEIRKVSNKKVLDLLMLSWLGILEEASNYRKAGNGLKVRKTIKKTIRDEALAKKLFFNSVSEILEDLDFSISISKKVQTKIIEDTCFNLDKHSTKGSIKGVIFSPPYANCFDYTEIYKVELWMGDFVKEYSDLKLLRKRSIRSHLNGYEIESKHAVSSVPELGILVNELAKKDLWDKRIPKMIEAYFNDMYKSIDQIHKGLKKGGFCTIIVSNSAYGGVVVPTDLLLAKYAKGLGFKVSKIEVARYIITSSQQYKETEKYRGYLRESIIYLEK
jgi:DNA modification methylase